MNDSIFPVLALIRSFKASSLKYASKRLEKEGIYVELNRTATSRNYKAKFIDPSVLEE